MRSKKMTAAEPNFSGKHSEPKIPPSPRSLPSWTPVYNAAIRLVNHRKLQIFGIGQDESGDWFIVIYDKIANFPKKWEGFNVVQEGE